MSEIPFSSLQRWVSQCGFELYAVVRRAQVEPILGSSAEKLREWQERGYAGEMAYMNRPVELFTTFQNIHPETRTIVVVVAPYSRRASEAAKVDGEWGRVARYAWGRDYHRVLKKRLHALVDLAREASGGEILARVFSDAVPILERSIVASSGLGFIGKNTLFIRPGDGSFSFIGEILWDAEVCDIPDPPTPRRSFSVVESVVPGSGCGRCSRCLTACPTGAFPEPGVLDSRRCIAYLTIEKREPFNDWEAAAVGEWLFGCDICQEVCPFNHPQVPDPVIPEFHPSAGVGPFLELRPLLELSTDDQFLRRFGGTALMRAGRERMIRNGCAVAANTGAVSLLPQLIEVLFREPARALRRQAAASLQRLQPLTTGVDRIRVSRALEAASEELFESSGAE